MSSAPPQFHEYEILADCTGFEAGGASHRHVRAIYASPPQWARVPCDETREAHIDTVWRQRLAHNPALFNGTKFRFHNVRVSSDDQGETMLEMHLGLTDYKSFLGTNMCDDYASLRTCSSSSSSSPPPPPRRRDARAHFDGDVSVAAVDPDDDEIIHSRFASPLGTAMIVETSDGDVLLLRRSGAVGEAPHTVVLPGGHPEPSHCGIDAHDTTAATGSDVTFEVFESALSEVVEETGVCRSSLGAPIALGISRRLHNVRPDVVFLISCSSSSHEVLKGACTCGKKEKHHPQNDFRLTIIAHTHTLLVLPQRTPRDLAMHSNPPLCSP